LAAGISLALSMGVARSLAGQLPRGDEPHYLIVTQSLLHDGDLRIENNHARREYLPYVDGDLQPDFIRRGRDGAIYSIHAPGLPLLVLPAFAVFGYHGVQWFIAAIAALTAGLMWLAGWLVTRDKVAAWIAWASVATSVTFLFQSVAIFPDGPGALMVAGGAIV